MNSNNKQIAKKPSIEYEENDCRTNQECFKQTSFTNTELVEQKKIKFISKNEEKISLRRNKSFNPQIYRNVNKRKTNKSNQSYLQRVNSKCIMIKELTKSLESFLMDNQKSIHETIVPKIKSETNLNTPMSCQTWRSSLSHNTNQNFTSKTGSPHLFDVCTNNINDNFKSSFLQKSIITDNIIDHSDRLEIKNEIGAIFKGKITINAGGIEQGGLQQRRDGITIFGFEGKNPIDYKVLLKRKNQKTNNVIFDIAYNTDTMCYYLRPTKHNAPHILFVKVENRIYITNSKKQIVLGKCLYTFMQDINSGTLIMKEFDKATKKENCAFYEKGNIMKDVSIGLGKVFFCDFADRWYLSFCEEKNMWYVDHDFELDPDVDCWRVVDDSIAIKESMKIKISQSVFSINYIKKEDI